MDTTDLLLKPLGLILIVLDFLIWLITLGPIWMLLKPQHGVRARKVGEHDCNGDLPPSPIFRGTQFDGLVETPFINEVATIYDLVKRAYRVYGGQNALGVREFICTKKLKDTDRFPARHYGPTQWITYNDVGVRAHDFGAGLRALGMQPAPRCSIKEFEKATGAFKMLIFEETCPEWQIACQGAFSQSIVVSTAYATLGVEAVVDAVNEGGVSIILTNFKQVEKIQAMHKSMPTLTTIIYTTHECSEDPRSKGYPKLEAAGGLTILSVDDVVERGSGQPTEPVPPAPDQIAVIMYTSGSTGKPKGVMVKHSQLLAMSASVRWHLDGMLKEGGETYLAYLPLAHILEMSAEFFFFGFGAKLGYADPKSLTAGPGKAWPADRGALVTYSPTVMAGVPKIWEVLKKAAEAKIYAGGKVKAFLFETALWSKSVAVPQGRYTPLFDTLVFKKFKGILGGKLAFALSGGGPIHSAVQDWCRTAFGCPLVQGYGLTETCGGLTIQHPTDWELGVAGDILPSNEVVLRSTPDVTDINGNPYLATDVVDKDGKPCLGRGEVWVRGNNVTSGYYKKPDKTAADYDEDGFFHTGDVGLFRPNGSLQIVDRIKNLVKLKGGEYIRTEQMNNAYNNSDFVDAVAGGVYSYGDGDMDRPVCLVQCDHGKLEGYALANGIEYSTIEDLASNQAMNEAVFKDLREQGKKGGLSSLELIAGCTLLTDPWDNSTNNCLTATNKLQPRVIQRFNAAELEDLKNRTQK